MHELPEELTNNLRSFRGRSLYDSRAAQPQNVALDAEPQAYGDKEFDRALSDTESSILPSSGQHSAVSGQAMDQTRDIEKHEAALPPLTSPHQEGKGNNTASRKQQESMDNSDDDPQVNDLDPAAARLATDLTPLSLPDFYSLMGVSPPTTPQEALVKLAHPDGLYGQIHRDMVYNNRKFKAFDLAAYNLLGLQIAISAVFIILGSLRNVDTHVAIPVLGAVATIISGVLALMKGQGLPNRLRITRDSLQNVLFAADELYWDIRSGRPVLYKDIKKVREDYLRAIESARKNHPDAWTGTDAIERGMSKQGGRPRVGNL